MKINGIALLAFLFVVHIHGKFEQLVNPKMQLNCFIDSYNGIVTSTDLGDVQKYNRLVALERKINKSPKVFDREGNFEDRYDELMHHLSMRIDNLKRHIRRSTLSDFKFLRSHALSFSPGFEDLKAALDEIDRYRQRNARRIIIAGPQLVQKFGELKDVIQAKVDGLTALQNRMTERFAGFREAYRAATGNVQALAALRDDIEAYIAAEDQRLLASSDIFDTHGLSELRTRVIGDVRSLGGPLREPRTRRRLNFGLGTQEDAAASSSQ